MSLKHRLLAATYPCLRLGNASLRRIGIRPSGRLRVLLYHDIAPHEEDRFAAHLRWLAQTWQFVDPQKFAAMVSGEEPVKDDHLLLTFDDGFASNRLIAERVLNPMGIRALFFIISCFAELSDADDRRAFIARGIYPGMDPATMPRYWQNMTWNDLSFLLETGHTIGAHTATHARLSQIVRADELEAEIIDSADMLEQKLGVKVEHFAYTFGNLASFSPLALAIARKRFRFIHTGLRGNNAHGVLPWALRRDAMKPTDSLALTGALLEGGADLRYAEDLATLESWGMDR